MSWPFRRKITECKVTQAFPSTNCLIKFRNGYNNVFIRVMIQMSLGYNNIGEEKKSQYLGSHSHLHGISKLFDALKHQSTSFNSKFDVLGCIVSAPRKPTSNLQQNMQARLSHQTKTTHIRMFSKIWYQHKNTWIKKQCFPLFYHTAMIR